MQRFASEIAQLRGLGFAEALPIERPVAQGTITRLECGRYGLAVEFLATDSAAVYSVIPLVSGHGRAHLASDIWQEVLRTVWRHSPLADGD
jgi:hypothetical protein